MASDSKVELVRLDMTDVDEHIHFNNAGDSPMPRSVLRKVQDVLQREHIIGGYATQAEYENELASVYEKIRLLINAADAHTEVALVDSATTAWVRAFYGIPLKSGDVIISTAIEYAANYVAILQQCKRSGAELVTLSSDPDTGLTSLIDLRSKLQHYGDRVRVVSITWIPTNGGIVDCAAEIGQVCKELAPQAVYLLDACQAVGHIVVDVQQLQCDVLTATGRKYLRGPRGTGFLYVRESSLLKLGEPITLDHEAARLDATAPGGYTLSPTARRFEQWEKNISGLLGLGAAVEYILNTVDMTWAEARTREIAHILRTKLSTLPGVTVRDLGARENQCGIVTFTVDSVAAHEVKSALLRQQIYVNVSYPGSTPVDAANRQLPPLMRASVHYFNTIIEVDRFCDALFTIIHA